MKTRSYTIRRVIRSQCNKLKYEAPFYHSISIALNLFIIMYFAYLLWSITLFSSSFELLATRSIDEYAMQFSIFRYQEHLLSGDIDKIFFNYDYAYGWFYWILFSAFSLPWHLLNEAFPSEIGEQAQILSVRIVNPLALGLLVVLIYLTLRNLSKNDSPEVRLKCKAFASSFLLMPSLGFWVGRPNPPIISTLFFALSLYLITRQRVLGTNQILLVSGLLGISVGIKINHIMYVPAIIVCAFIWRKEDILRVFNFQNTLKAILVFAFSLTMSISPLIVFMPHKYFSEFWKELNYFRVASTGEHVTQFSQFINNINESAGIAAFGQFVLYLFFIYALYKIFFDKSSSILVKLFLLYIMSLLVYLAFTVGRGSLLLQSYLFPIFLIVSLLVFSQTTNIWEIQKKSTLILLLIPIMASLNFFSHLDSISFDRQAINSYHVGYLISEKSGELKMQAEVQASLPRTLTNITLFQDWTLPTVTTPFRPNVNLTFVFDNWEQYSELSINKDFYLLIDKRNRDWLLSESQEEFMNTLSASQKILQEIVSRRKFNDSVCEIVKEGTLYIFMRCNV
jgi:hypothetical protein